MKKPAPTISHSPAETSAHIFVALDKEKKYLALTPLKRNQANLLQPNNLRHRNKFMTKQTQNPILNNEGHRKDAKRLNAAVSKVR